MSDLKEFKHFKDGESSQLTRRAVLQSAAAFTVAATMPGISAAQTHDAEGSRYSGDQPTASITRNIVETDSGKVSGYESGGIITFKGIPYGASTEGANRFMPPAKPKPWTGVRSAWHWGPVSPQAYTSTWDARRLGWTHDDEAFMFQWEEGQPGEDCLRANVWTPGLDNNKRPVMVWLHGGGFYSGSSNELAAYDGENLARRGDVVVVSVNHRLGPLGFLDLSEYGDQYTRSADVGVLDLVAALQWVKLNIGGFGGDPGSVLIFGQSGGGGKVSTLMAMPAAQGLFHRAAIQSSGSAIVQFPRDVSLRTGAAMVKELGLDKSSIEKIHEMTNEEIIEAAVRVSKLAGSSGSPQPGFGSWGPVVDGHDLPRNAWEPAAPDPSARVPLMVGSVLNEGANSIQMGSASYEDMSMEEVKTRLGKQFPGKAEVLIEEISKVHSIRKPFDIYTIAGGLPRRVDVLKMAGLKTVQGQAPAYVYKFVWQSPMLDGRARAYHCSELPFVFNNAERCSSMTGGEPESAPLAAQISNAWIAFARKGDPNHPGLPKWEPFSDHTKPTMVFDTHCELKRNMDDAQVEAAQGFTSV